MKNCPVCASAQFKKAFVDGQFKSRCRKCGYVNVLVGKIEVKE